MMSIICQFGNPDFKIGIISDVVTIKNPNFCNDLCLHMKVYSSMCVKKSLVEQLNIWLIKDVLVTYLRFNLDNLYALHIFITR